MKLIAKGAYDVEGRRQYLSRAEGKEFLRHSALLSESEAVFCDTLYYTGCRISEVLNMRRCDIDETMNTILIRSLKKRDKRQIRRIPVPERLTKRLLKISTSETGRLWPFSRTTGWRIIKALMKVTNVSGIHATTKGLRHGFGVRSALGNVPLPIIQRWMGHADPSTTAIYLEVKDEEERELIGRTW